MTKPDLMAELAEVVQMAPSAAWTSGLDGHGGVSLETDDCDGNQIATFRARKRDNAKYVAALHNFLRTHHAELEAVVRDAARYRWLASRAYVQDHDGGWSSTYHFYAIARHDGSTYKGATPYRHETLDVAVDHAMHNSAREG